MKEPITCDWCGHLMKKLAKTGMFKQSWLYKCVNCDHECEVFLD